MSTPHIAVADSPRAAAAHLPSWQRLARAALDPNVFLEPDFVLPLIRSGVKPGSYRLVFVLGASGEAIALAALGARRSLTPAGPRALSTWSHPFVLDATPLLHRDHARTAAGALQRWLTGRRRPWSVVRWDRVAMESATWRQLEDAADALGRRSFTRLSFRRPELRCQGSFESFLGALPAKRRGRLRWRMNRLAREGGLRVRLHRDLSDADLIDRFLRLESSGWKGRAGTALACSPADKAFFRSATAAFARSGGLYFVELELDGRPLAITANYRAGGSVALFKSAYDERFDGLSPGMVNLLHLTRLSLEDPEVQHLDSCARPDSHLEQLWSDGFAFGEALLPTRAGSRLAVGALPWLRRTRTALRTTARRLAPAPAPRPAPGQ